MKARVQVHVGFLFLLIMAWGSPAIPCLVLANGRPEPRSWFAGDPHVHRDCGGVQGDIVGVTELLNRMKTNDLAVMSVLADMGNGEVREASEDLPRINGKDDPASALGRIVHWDAEWHFDPRGIVFDQKSIGGHLILLGLKRAQRMFSESTHPILVWAKKQGAITGFAHMQYLPMDEVPRCLSCCLPLEYPVEMALGTVDFLMEDVGGADAAVSAYYRLLNCGFRPGLAAGTDFPCNDQQPLGTLLTYVHIPDNMPSYRKWIDGLAGGRSVVSRNGHSEFLELRVNRSALPGDEVKISHGGEVKIEVRWTGSDPLSGQVELLRNGVVVVTREATVRPGVPFIFETTQRFEQSGWLAARRMGEGGHRTHTAAIFVTVRNAPVRASSEDAEYFVRFIDHLIKQTSEGGFWSRYFPRDREAVLNRYRRARAVYSRIAREAERMRQWPTASPLRSTEVNAPNGP
ncbi:MAG: CehA/McbA family metallohydrolase [Acidobacteriota bacterium]